MASKRIHYYTTDKANMGFGRSPMLQCLRQQTIGGGVYTPLIVITHDCYFAEKFVITKAIELK